MRWWAAPRTARNVHLSWPIAALSTFALALAHGQEIPREHDLQLISSSADASIRYDFETGVGVATNGVQVVYGPTSLVASNGLVRTREQSVAAAGAVFLNDGTNIWTGDSIDINFQSEELEAHNFRAGHPPFFMEGKRLSGAPDVYEADSAALTVSDYETPDFALRAGKLRVYPQDRIEANDATLFLGPVPIFYLPYVRMPIDGRYQAFTVTPGFRTKHGAYLLTESGFSLGSRANGILRLDARSKRGIGLGPEVRYDLGNWGSGQANFYYLNDLDPDERVFEELDLDPNRYILSLNHRTEIDDQTALRVSLNRQSDERVERDFFEGRFRSNPQPDSFVELARHWRNGRVSLLAQSQMNPFFEGVERLPELQLDVFRTQIPGIELPLFYESRSLAGYYKRTFNRSGFSDFSAGRADAYHQLTAPIWLGILRALPRIAFRASQYTEAEGSGPPTQSQSRLGGHAGIEVGAKATGTWANARSEFLDLDGLRHIVRPSINYAFTPYPSEGPESVPQFDPAFETFQLTPFEYPLRNSIDAFDARNVARIGLENRLQTKRDGAVTDILSWRLATDLNLNRDLPPHSRFQDLYSLFETKPRAWISARSEIRYSLDDAQLRFTDNRLYITPYANWGVDIGHRFVRENDPLISPIDTLRPGSNLLTSRLAYRFSQEWSAYTRFQYELNDSTLEEHSYSLARDLRSLTTALTFRVRNERDRPRDFSIAFTVSLKARPTGSSRSDRTLQASDLLGER